MNRRQFIATTIAASACLISTRSCACPTPKPKLSATTLSDELEIYFRNGNLAFTVNPMNKVFVSGGAGFLGTNMVLMLAARYPGCKITVFDNFSTGKLENKIPSTRKDIDIEYINCDLLEPGGFELRKAMEHSDLVFHFAANADIRNGPTHRQRDLDQNIQATLNVLEAMVATGVQKIVFTSTAPVYSESPLIPTPEDAPMTAQSSLYAASKLAAEGYITSFGNYFGIQSYIFRLVSMLGPYYSHGHVIDWFNALTAHPDHLDVLGNGSAVKTYLHVVDACDAILHAITLQPSDLYHSSIFNLGLDEPIRVSDAATLVAALMGLRPKLRFGSGPIGWPGDCALVRLDTSKIRSTGWSPKFTLDQAYNDTIHFLRFNPSAARTVSAPDPK